MQRVASSEATAIASGSATAPTGRRLTIGLMAATALLAVGAFAATVTVDARFLPSLAGLATFALSQGLQLTRPQGRHPSWRARAIAGCVVVAFTAVAFAFRAPSPRSPATLAGEVQRHLSSVLPSALRAAEQASYGPSAGAEVTEIGCIPHDPELVDCQVGYRILGVPAALIGPLGGQSTMSVSAQCMQAHGRLRGAAPLASCSYLVVPPIIELPEGG